MLNKIRAIESCVRRCFNIDNGGDRLFIVKNRTQPHADARAALQYILYNELDMTVVEVSKLFNQDHTTVVYNIHKVQNIIYLNRNDKRNEREFIKQYNDSMFDLRKEY